MVSDVAAFAFIACTPLGSGLSKQSHIEYIGFAGVDRVFLFPGKGGWHQFFFDGIGMYAVIDLC